MPSTAAWPRYLFLHPLVHPFHFRLGTTVPNLCGVCDDFTDSPHDATHVASPPLHMYYIAFNTKYLQCTNPQCKGRTLTSEFVEDLVRDVCPDVSPHDRHAMIACVDELKHVDARLERCLRSRESEPPFCRIRLKLRGHADVVEARHVAKKSRLSL